MSSKRKPTSLGLERRVRPRREDDWEPEVGDDSSADDVSEEGIGRDDESEDGSEIDSEEEEDSEADEADDDNGAKVDLSTVSFGALARAQASLPPIGRKKKKPAREETPSEEPEEAPSRTRKPLPPQISHRTSKHAPQEMSSKRAVSRRREIIADTGPKHRDPRFEPLGDARVDAARASRAYSFLDEYRDREMADLRAQIKKTKDARAKEDLKRQLMSMESKKKARQRKEDEDKLLAEHRKQEKELVAQGKKPFYLKKSEQKKRLLMDRFAGMSKGQVDKAIAKKRKKVAGKEKKELDSLVRVRDRHER
ncbi:hypothetical protein B0I35DRAFT_432779 [Stachybotrys elegans]|uniref:rRNA biogenesis protein RRP36 n=1 Tax=Stachybotrys elegans TaxID=80388 RepID=A0A8K0SMM9_9HYPO|nr:hypothetical protein B0I35DRAFT_432779 [Stachybotrys elegans]